VQLHLCAFQKDQEEMVCSSPYIRPANGGFALFSIFTELGRRFPILYTGVAAIFASSIHNGNPPLIFEDGAQLATSLAWKM